MKERVDNLPHTERLEIVQLRPSEAGSLTSQISRLFVQSDDRRLSPAQIPDGRRFHGKNDEPAH
jgi:hypothetical protein